MTSPSYLKSNAKWNQQNNDVNFVKTQTVHFALLLNRRLVLKE